MDQGNSIHWYSEIQEGIDRPPEFGIKKCYEKYRTVGFMCRMTEPIKSRGNYVTMDSVFILSVGIVEIERVMVVYSQ
jgi:hypothetical protein